MIQILGPKNSAAERLWPGLSFLVGLGAATNVRSPIKFSEFWVCSFVDGHKIQFSLIGDRKKADDGIAYLGY